MAKTGSKPSITKPTIDADVVHAFAERSSPTGKQAVPAGDVRLNANVRRELHLRIKIEAARQGKSIGQMIEELIDRHIP